MSYLHPNPANQNQGGSGGAVIVLQSGTLPVMIAGSFGSTTFADVNSSTSADNMSTGDDVLSTRAAVIAYNPISDQFVRIRAIPVNSGVNQVTVPTSGFGLQTAGVILSTHGVPAEIWTADDDDMFSTDQLLQTAARAYGLKQDTSGWARVKASLIASGAGYALNVAISGQTVVTSVSGISINISGQTVYLTSGKNDVMIKGTLGGPAVVFPPNSDDMAATDDSLLTLNHNYGLNRGSGGDWARIDASRVTGSGRVTDPHSGFALYTASMISDTDGVIANVASQQFGDTSEVLSGSAAHALGTLAKNYGLNQLSGQWARIRAVDLRSIESGAVQSGFALLTASIITDDGGRGPVDINGVQTDAESVGSASLYTSDFLHGYLETSTSWARIRATASGAAFSGIHHKLAVAFSGDVVQIGEGGDVVNVQNNTNIDTVATTDNALTSMSLNYGFHQISGTWARARIVGLDSLESGAVESGLALLTAGLIMDTTGLSANVRDPDFDTAVTTVGALDTASFTYGYTPVTNNWVRIRATASGAAFSGIAHKLAVAFSGDIIQIGEGGNVVDVQSSTTSDNVSTADNALFSVGLNYGYWESGGTWSRIRSEPTQSGRNYALLVKDQEPQTFVATVENLNLLSGGGKFMQIWHQSGTPIVKIRDIRVHPVNFGFISGEVLAIDVTRTKWAPSGGTSLSATTYDPRNNESGVALQIKFNSTNFSGGGAPLLNTINTRTEGWEANRAAITSGIYTAGILQTLTSMFNLAPGANGKSTQPFTLTSGYGIAIGQSTTYGMQTSGEVTVMVEYTVENF